MREGEVLLLDFIIKYWTEFLFGIVAAGILAGGKYIWTLFKNRLKDSLEEQITSITDVITKRMSETDEKLEAKNTSLTQQLGELQADMKIMQQEIQTNKNDENKIEKKIDTLKDNLNTLKGGILSLQRKELKEECRKLLNQKEAITYEQYTMLQHEHTIYNSLGGNHEGDQLFKLVSMRYANTNAVQTEKKGEQ